MHSRSESTLGLHVGMLKGEPLGQVLMFEYLIVFHTKQLKILKFSRIQNLENQIHIHYFQEIN